MKKQLFFILLLFGFKTYSQTDSLYIKTNVHVNIISLSIEQSKQKIHEFLRVNNITTQFLDDDKSNLVLTFVVTESQYISLQTLYKELGYINSNNIQSEDNTQKVKEIMLELAFLKEKKRAFDEMYAKSNHKDEKYYSIWNDCRLIDERIFTKQKELLQFDKSKYTIKLNLQSEKTVPNSSKVSFVNMPGFEYSFLKVETPLDGLSSKYYDGYFLKYLITKGKSYVQMGVYKSQGKHTSDTTMYTDLLLCGFGQDFYSRHFGRGSRHFFNLYSGYSLGGIFANAKTRKTTLYYAAPSVGVELFKTKYILFDTKVSYFVPINLNKNLRGLTYNMSFNFVF